jgi:hypothetical protein
MHFSRQTASSEKLTARILIIGDMHFSERSVSILPIVCHQLLEHMRRLAPDHTVHLGDFLDRFGNINSKRLTEATTFLGQASDICPSTAVIGNHDIPKKRDFLSPNHGFGALHRWDQSRMQVADTKCITWQIKGMWFRAVPYCPNGRLWEALRSSGENGISRYSATFCHQELNGHHMEHLTGTTGDPWPLGSGLAVAGHLHEWHHMPATASRDEILYVGSPYQDNYTESPNKSISLLTFHPNGSWSEERIFLQLPKKVKLCMLTSQYALWQPEADMIYTLILTGGSTENAEQSVSEKSAVIRQSGTITFVRADIAIRKETPRQISPVIKPLREELSEIIRRERPYLWDSYLRVFGK